MAEPKSELQQFLQGTEITVEQVRSAVALLAATAKGQPSPVVRNDSAGAGVTLVRPLPDAGDVRPLAQRLESVETRLQETNEKLDKVLAALSAK